MKTSQPHRIRLRDLCRQHKAVWSLSFGLGVLTVFATVALLAWSGWFISAAAAAGVGASFNYLRPGALIRLFAIMRTAGRYGERVLSHALVLRLLAILRVQVFIRLARHSGNTAVAAGDRLQRLIADIDVLDQLPLRLLNPLGYASLLSAAFLLLLWLLLPSAFWPLAGLLLLLVLAIVGCSHMGTRGPVQQAAAEAQLQGQRRGLLLENLQLLTTLLTTGHWQQRQQQFIRLDQQVLQLQQRQQYGQLAAQILLQVLMLAGMAALCWPMFTALIAQQPFPLAAPLWLGLLLAWLGLSELLLPLLLLPQSYGQLRAAQQRCNALAEPALSAPVWSSAVVTAPAAPELNQPVTLEIRQLQFGFQRPLGVLSESFKSGDVVLLKGPSGSGKSCLLQTLAAEIPALGGTALLQELALQQWPTEALYRQIGYLPQRPYLFGLSVAADLRLAKPSATDEELLQVLALVGLDDWLARQPQGLLTVLGDYGVGLSGGELKRFALARLLLQKPAVLLLDEPFAGLQQQLAQQLLQRLAAFQQHGILIIVSHQQQQNEVFNREWSLHYRVDQAATCLR